MGERKWARRRGRGRATVGGHHHLPKSLWSVAPKGHITSCFCLSTGQIVLSGKALVYFLFKLQSLFLKRHGDLEMCEGPRFWKLILGLERQRSLCGGISLFGSERCLASPSLFCGNEGASSAPIQSPHLGAASAHSAAGQQFSECRHGLRASMCMHVCEHLCVRVCTHAVSFRQQAL